MRSHKALHAAAIVLVIAAAVIRLHNLGAVSHYIDNAYPIWQALGIIDRGVFPLTGQMSSIGIPNPPLTAYLFVPVVMMTRSALTVYVVVILLNSLAVGLGYLLGKRLFNASAGLLIAALMAFNPWLIEYSRFTWVQSLMPFLMTLLALLLMPLLAGMVEPQQRFRQTFAVMTTILVIVGTYLLGVVILLPIGVLFLIYRVRLDWRAVALGGVIMLLMLLPYAIQTINLSAEGIESNTDSQASLSTTALFHAVRFVTGDGYATRFDTNLQMRQSLEQLVVLPVLICLLAGVVRAVWAIWKHPGRERSIAVILLVWLVLTILPLSYSARPVQVHYQMLGVPAGYVLAAWGALPILRRSVGQIAVIGVMIPFCVVMLINSNVVTSQPYDADENQNLYRLPLVMGETYADAIVRNLPPDGVVFADTVEPILNSLSGRSFPVLRTYDANTRIIPSNGGIVVYTARAGEALPDAPRFSTPVEEFQVENGLQFGLFLFPAGDFELPAAVQTLDIPTQQGLRLMAYSLTSNNSQSRWTLTTYWQVEDTETQTSQSAYGMFIHTINPNGEVVQSMDGKVIPGFDWHPGDVHIHRLRIDSQPEITALRIGQFDASRAENMVFLLPDGSQSIFVELPLISTEQGGE